MTLTLLSNDGTLNNLILNGNGEHVLAEGGSACCCGEFNCCCTRISEVVPPPTLKARIINACAKMNGVEWDLTPHLTIGVCRKWDGRSALQGLGTDCIWQIDLQFNCSRAPGVPSDWSDYYIYLDALGNDQCAADLSQTNVFPYAGQCGITGIGTDKFYARYTGFSLVNGIGPNCNCCESYDIEIYEP